MEATKTPIWESPSIGLNLRLNNSNAKGTLSVHTVQTTGIQRQCHVISISRHRCPHHLFLGAPGISYWPHRSGSPVTALPKGTAYPLSDHKLCGHMATARSCPRFVLDHVKVTWTSSFHFLSATRKTRLHQLLHHLPLPKHTQVFLWFNDLGYSPV